jgi:membrane-associated phospholipid phosphatase
MLAPANWRWIGRCLLLHLLAAAAIFAQEPPPAPDVSWSAWKKMPSDILRDQKALWASPFHIKRKNVKWWIAMGAVTGALIATDRRASRELPNTPDQQRFSNNVSRIGASYTMAAVAGGSYLAGTLTHRDYLAETGLLAAEALLDGVIVSEALKVVTQRPRPLEGNRGGDFLDGGYSFPSGHAVTNFALASVIAHRYPHKKALVIASYGLAGLVGASRFSAQQHFASDIVVGGVIGYFIGRHVVQSHERPRPGVRGWLSPQVIPTFQPSDHSYGVLLAWHPGRTN